MTELIVVTGPPGAGKSTVARVLADRFDHSVIVTGDTFFTFVASGAILPWLPESDAQNEVITRAAAAAAGQYARGGYITVFDGVVGPWARTLYDEFARGQIDDRHVLRDPPDTVEAVADAIVRMVESNRARYSAVDA